MTETAKTTTIIQVHEYILVNSFAVAEGLKHNINNSQFYLTVNLLRK